MLHRDIHPNPPTSTGLCSLHNSEKWVSRVVFLRLCKTIFNLAATNLIPLYLLQNGREGRGKQNCLHEARIGFNPPSRICCHCSHRFSHRCREIACRKSQVFQRASTWGIKEIKGLICNIIFTICTFISSNGESVTYIEINLALCYTTRKWRIPTAPKSSPLD